MEPVQPGIYLISRVKSDIVIEFWLKSVLYFNEQLHVQNYYTSQDSFTVLLPPKPLLTYNQKDFRWVLLQPDLSKFLL